MMFLRGLLPVLLLRAAFPAFRIIGALFLPMTMTAVAADEEPGGPEVGFLEENDLFVRTDRNYTQGIKAWFFQSDNTSWLGTDWITNGLPSINYEPTRWRLGYEIGQSMYTPADYTLPVPSQNDRPYAGWLYVGMMLERDGATPDGTPTRENLQLELGVVGPWSLGKEAQIWVHEIRSFTLPEGWHHQLKNEPGFQLRYRRAARYDLVSWGPFGSDFVPYGGFVLGHPETSGRLGGLVRVGFHMPQDFGPHVIDSLAISSVGRPRDPHSPALYGFIGAEGRAVAHNAFLDGNLFHESRSVDKEPLVGDFSAGFRAAWKQLSIGYTHVFRTQEYKGQPQAHQFGSIHVSLSF